MKLVDANIVIRYLLNDDELLADKAAEILENNVVFIPNEVIAEIVYVLEKVYNVKNDVICDTLLDFFQYKNIEVEQLEIVKEALSLFGRKRLDFVDSLLYAYHKVKGHKVYTFDKKLNKLLEV